MYPFLSEQQLTHDLYALRDHLSRPNALFPEWFDRSPADILSTRQFVVCGSGSRSEIRVLAKAANVIAIVDDFLCKQQTHLFGIPVISSDSWIGLAAGQADVVSCLLVPGGAAFQHFTKLATQWDLPTLLPLQFLHLLEQCSVDRRGETGRFFWYGYEFFTATLAGVDRLVTAGEGFADSYSRVSWLCVLLYRLTLNPFYLEACAVGHNHDGFKLNAYSTNRQFFQFSDREVYVDGGAFDGDTLEGFLRACNGQFQRIHSFEPSSANNHLIRARLAGLQNSYLKSLAANITLHQRGLWDCTTELRFNPGLGVADFETGGPQQPASAHLLEAGMVNHIYEQAHEDQVSVTVPVTTIDEATECTATFIKLEIEGSELQALHGARQTIADNRPKMAISMYHKPEDLLSLTDFVAATDKGYKLGFRQHNRLCPDAMVMYCF